MLDELEELFDEEFEELFDEEFEDELEDELEDQFDDEFEELLELELPAKRCPSSPAADGRAMRRPAGSAASERPKAACAAPTKPANAAALAASKRETRFIRLSFQADRQSPPILSETFRRAACRNTAGT